MRLSTRFAVLAVLSSALVAGAGLGLAPRRAVAEDPVDPLAALQRDVRYLKLREARLSAYLLKNAARADALERLTSEVRSLGFTAAANPAAARERLLGGLTELARSLRADLPTVNDAEAALGGPAR